MLFSVVIPTFNRRDILPRTLESVWQQRMTDYEIIVVDDGSTDGTIEYLRSLREPTRVLTQPNTGPGAARNLGIVAARGDYVAFLDSDDLWFPWSLETYASAIRDSDNPAFIAGKPFCFRDESELRDITLAELRTMQFSDYISSGNKWRWWGASSFVIRTDALRQTVGFPQTNMNGEDSDLALKLGEARGFVQILSPLTFGYREHAANARRDLSKTVAGVWHKIREEQSGAYPGGASRARARKKILSRHIRPVALECLRAGLGQEAWRLYWATLPWHIALGRWKFLFGFPVYSFLPRR